jgi:ketosteroid isomerase-like protein
MNNNPVIQFFEAYAAAVNAKDVDAFTDLYADDVHVFDAWERWQHSGIESWRAMAAGWFGSLGDETVHVSFDEVGSAVGQDVALGHAAVTFAAVSASGERLRAMTNRFSVGLEKRDGGWKVVHEHSSLPIDLGSGKGIFEH